MKTNNVIFLRAPMTMISFIALSVFIAVSNVDALVAVQSLQTRTLRPHRYNFKTVRSMSEVTRVSRPIHEDLPVLPSIVPFNNGISHTNGHSKYEGSASLSHTTGHSKHEEAAADGDHAARPESMDLALPVTSEVSASNSWHDALAEKELRFMRLVQRAPGLRPLALAVHYSLLPQVVTPALAMVAWLVSLPAAASLVCFVCTQDIINTAIKWAVMRPRPLWYSSDAGLNAKIGSKSWEADFSFPSAHTQFFSGLAFCACILSGCANLKASLSIAFGFGTIIGLTRNYLGVHWPTDTFFGLLVGGGLGLMWGKLDPYTWLLQKGSPLLSLGVATGLTGGLILLLMLIRVVVPPVDSDTHSQWCANVFSSLPPEERKGLDPTAFASRPRELRFKIAMLSTIWCTLAFTALCPSHLPSAMAEPGRSASYKLMQTMVGMGGLAGCGFGLKRTIMGRLQTLVLSDTLKTLFKGFAYAGICAWTFLLSQLASHRLLALIGL